MFIMHIVHDASASTQDFEIKGLNTWGHFNQGYHFQT